MRTSRLLALLACLVATGAGAQEVPPPLSAQCEAPNADISIPAPLPRLSELLERRAAVKILAIGSSSTAGVGASSVQRAYPAQLQELLRLALKGVEAQIVNRGVSGEVARTTAERLRTEVAISKPDVVLWQVGTNDALARVPVEDFETVLRSTVAWLKANRIDPVLVGLQYSPQYVRDEHYFAIREALRRVAESENVLFVRRYTAMQFIAAHSKDGLVSDDGLHLNDLGYRCMAEHIARGVITSLFLRRRDVPGQQPSRPRQ